MPREASAYARRQYERSEVERGGSASLLVEGVLNPIKWHARLSGEAPRKDLKQRTRALLIYSGRRSGSASLDGGGAEPH